MAYGSGGSSASPVSSSTDGSRLAECDVHASTFDVVLYRCAWSSILVVELKSALFVMNSDGNEISGMPVGRG